MLLLLGVCSSWLRSARTDTAVSLLGLGLGEGQHTVWPAALRLCFGLCWAFGEAAGVGRARADSSLMVSLLRAGEGVPLFGWALTFH